MDEYPEAFRSQMPSLAGYIFHAGDANHARGYFVTTARQRYDFQDSSDGQGRGLLLVTRDPLGRDTTIAYDSFELLPMRVTDPVGLTTQAEYDYRVMQPNRVTDPNGNRQQFGFTPLGLLAWIAVMGKEGEEVGDSPEVPGTWLTYDFLAFEERQQPISVRTTQREHHLNETDVPDSQRDDTIETIEYSDGFGRLLQTRTQAEDVVFGSLPFGGEVGLPADQSVPVGDAVGQELAPEDLPRVVVSGWQVYDNKGRVVEKYEPFYATGWEYVPPVEEEMGQKATMFYDPRGQVIRTVNLDGSEQRVIYGVPESLNNPERFAPTPWEAYTYDANDNAGRTHVAESTGYQAHWNTPANVVVDALGRTVEAVERNGSTSGDRFVTRSTYDIRGNLLRVTDALGRVAFRYVYDLANNPLRTDSIDAGVRRSLLNAVGNETERRDSKGALILQAYDLLNRPSRLWARDDENIAVTLREVLEYGDGGDSNQTQTERDAARELNRLGQLVRHYDEAGRLSFAAFDFKGNLLEKTRRVIADEPIRAVFEAAAANNWQVEALRVNWQASEGSSLETHAETLLNSTEYLTSMTYDGLNRMKVMQYPEDVEGTRQELRPQYNRAGALERVTLNDDVYVERIAYNAKGQRILVAYGNGIMTRYVYDPETFRLRRLRSDRYDRTGLTYQPTGSPLQDFAYTYDLTGNILSIADRTPRSGVSNNIEALRFQSSNPQLAQALTAGDALFRQFEYDPLYRLRSATGRECRDIPRPRPMEDEPRCGFNQGTHGTPTQDNAPDLTALYRETYDYDPAGNMLTLRHQQAVNSNGGVSWENTWSRNFGMGLAPEDWNQEWIVRQQNWVGQRQTWDNPRSNRLTHVEQRLAGGGNNNPVVSQTHFFDANGNLVRENEARHFEWDSRDRMKAFRTQTEGAEPSIHAHYVYATGGQRVMKWVRRQGGQIDVTVYVDGVFEHHRRITVGGVQENNTLHVMDDQSRIALVRVGEPFDEDLSPAVKFQLGDHLGSSNVVVSDAGDWVNREEFTPYGETSFGSFGKKRYRYTEKERDEESGLNYYGARYYASCHSKWISVDPIGPKDGINLFKYSQNNPINFIDKHGYSSTEPEQQEAAKIQSTQVTNSTNLFDHFQDENPTNQKQEKDISPDNISESDIVADEHHIRGNVLRQKAIGPYAPEFVQSSRNKHEKGRAAMKDLETALERNELANSYLKNLGAFVTIFTGASIATGTSSIFLKLVGADVMISGGRTIVTQEEKKTFIASAAERGAENLGASEGQAIFIGMVVEGLAGNKSPRRFNRRFAREALKIIRSDKKHPLRFLLDKTGKKFASRAHGADQPAVQVGHRESFHSGAEEALFLEDADFNQTSNWLGETFGAIFQKRGVVIGGVHVEYRTAAMWERLGLLPEGTVAASPISLGRIF
jgi:RHS repeat-associated protein